MPRNKRNLLLMALAALTILIAGCDEDERLAKVATEAAERQAQQNKEMVRLNREVAEGTKRLVEADAAARQEQAAAQRDLQAQQARIGELRDQLETERREIAKQRRFESMLGPAIQACGALLVATLAFGFGLLLLLGLRHTDDSSEVLGDLIVQDLVSDRPVMLPFNDTPRAIEYEPDERGAHSESES